MKYHVVDLEPDGKRRRWAVVSEPSWLSRVVFRRPRIICIVYLDPGPHGLHESMRLEPDGVCAGEDIQNAIRFRREENVMVLAKVRR